MPDLGRTTDFLAKVPLLRSLKRRQLEGLAKVMVLREYKAGQDILTQGASGVGLFLVASGKAEAVHTRTDGSQAVVNEFAPGDFFGELALLSEGSRTASVVAVEATQCLVLTRWNFLGLLRSDAEVAVDILEVLADRFRLALEVL